MVRPLARRPTLSYTAYDMGVRINARLEDRLAKRVGAWQRRTGKSLTQIVEESLEQYCRAEPSRRPYEILAAAGFIGCADGAKDLASGYKAALRRGLERKT